MYSYKTETEGKLIKGKDAKRKRNDCHMPDLQALSTRYSISRKKSINNREVVNALAIV